MYHMRKIAARARNLLNRALQEQDGDIIVRPIVGGHFHRTGDIYDDQFLLIYNAIVARVKFHIEGPHLPLLPLSFVECEDLKCAGVLGYAVSLFAGSWQAVGYENRHPTFPVYIRAFLASPYTEVIRGRSMNETEALSQKYGTLADMRFGGGCVWHCPDRTCSVEQSMHRI